MNFPFSTWLWVLRYVLMFPGVHVGTIIAVRWFRPRVPRSPQAGGHADRQICSTKHLVVICVGQNGTNKKVKQLLRNIVRAHPRDVRIPAACVR